MEPLKKKDETLQIRCFRSTITKFRAFVGKYDLKYEEAILILLKVAEQNQNTVERIKDIIRTPEIRTIRR